MLFSEKFSSIWILHFIYVDSLVDRDHVKEVPKKRNVIAPKQDLKISANYRGQNTYLLQKPLLLEIE